MQQATGTKKQKSIHVSSSALAVAPVDLSGPMEAQAAARGSASRLITRTLAMIDVIVRDGRGHGLRLTEIARRLSLPVSTVHRLLAALVTMHYVEQDEATGFYRVGAGFLSVASCALAPVDVSAACLPELHHLRARTAEDAYLVVLDEGYAVDVAQAPNRRNRHRPVGRRASAHLTAAGKVLLATNGDGDKVYLNRDRLGSLTPHSITSPAELRRHLTLVASQGFAVDDEEHKLGWRCVAAPVRDASGRVVAAITVSGSANRLTLPVALGELATAVVAGANRASIRLGFRGVDA